jgi:hypothetical protein
MNTWAPLFSNVVDSSLWTEPDLVVKVFLTLLAKKDANHIVWGSAFNIAQMAKKTEAETLEALRILSSPDTRRLEPQEFEGRRIEKVDGGWLVLNGQKYRAEISALKRREYKRLKQQEYRERDRALKAVEAANDERQSRYDEAHGAGDTEAEGRIAAENLPKGAQA